MKIDTPEPLYPNTKSEVTLTAFLPDQPDPMAPAFLVFPGGGYNGLSEGEGATYAQRLAQDGFIALRLHYRLGSNGHRHPAMLHDALTAMAFARIHAVRYGFAPERLGIIGSSAGGHLAAMLLTHWREEVPEWPNTYAAVSRRPAFGVLCYPVISMSADFTHDGSRNALLGDRAPENLRRACSTELHVTDETPPCFLWHTADDPVVPVENSLAFASALSQSRVPFDLRVYGHGRHGLGLDTDYPWYRDMLTWVRRL